jgi:apolipoprotein D and lipocalin family protein
MKTIALLFISFLSLVTAMPNKTVSNVDSKKFAGTWYSLYSIPTMFDKGSKQTTTHYTLNKDGYYDVVTTCIKNGQSDIRTVKSKIFRVDGTTDGQMKAQFVWPFKVDYWVVDLAPDYSWAVVGHPDHKFLFIMSRKPEMDPKLHEEIVAKCKAMGYPVETLVSQQFPGAK